MTNVQPTRIAKIPVVLDISVPVTKEHVRSIKKKRLSGEWKREKTTQQEATILVTSHPLQAWVPTQTEDRIVATLFV